MLVALLVAVALLAYANGANDNFKGVATLLGSGTCNYRRALSWACLSTLAGSLGAIWLGSNLAQRFSGRGLLPDASVGAPVFLISVGVGAAATVILATRLGQPVSTTHSLTGALVGAGLVYTNGAVALSQLSSLFFAPLLLSPVVAMAGTVTLYLVFRATRLGLGIDKESCVCIGEKVLNCVALPAAREAVLRPVVTWRAAVGSMEYCRQTYLGNFLGIPVARAVEKLHYLSAGAVSFARGLNDTPKIAALLVAAEGLAAAPRYALVGLFIAIGGFVSARRVAETMSFRISSLNPGQGFSANLATALLVVGASGLGMPVSTTHVSAGSLFGIALLSGSADRRTISSIAASWIGTLPLAAVLGAIVCWGLKGYGAGFV